MANNEQPKINRMPECSTAVDIVKDTIKACERESSFVCCDKAAIMVASAFAEYLEKIAEINGYKFDIGKFYKDIGIPYQKDGWIR